MRTGDAMPSPLDQAQHKKLSSIPLAMCLSMLPLQLGAEAWATSCRILKMTREERWAKIQDPFKGTILDRSQEQRAMKKAGILRSNMSPMYFLLDPIHVAFKKRLDIHRYGANDKPLVGMVFKMVNRRPVKALYIGPFLNVPMVEWSG
jgi:hypothetical protein